MIDQSLGHYRIVEKIGSGGMGIVYRARDDRLGRDVALKVLKPDVASNPDRLRRFEQEARAAAALNHPNIVAIFDIGFHNEAPYIVSELLEGHTLRHKLVLGAVPVRLAIDYSIQIAQALVAAHEKRIVHRDLKPENLFITRDGRVKILDFGIAKLTTSEIRDQSELVEMTTQTKMGSVLGTVAYMSPEQLRAKAVDHRSDIFSFGAILYEMLTGKRAFSRDTDVDTMTAVLMDDVAEIQIDGRAVPRGVQQIVGHCLEKDPENRFQSAKDLVFALGAVANVSTTKQVVVLRSGRRQLRKWLPWAAAGLLAVACGILLGINLRSLPVPMYRRLSFERGTIYSARFAQGGRSVVYAASWNGKPVQLYSTSSDVPLEQPLGLEPAYLLGVSPSNELALALHAMHGAKLQITNGTLASAPLAGGAPREILLNVNWADWDMKGDLAVVHSVGGRSRLEYPIGKVLYESPGGISDIRFSPSGDRIAFIDHPSVFDDRGAVCVVDLNGKETMLSGGWASASGLAWDGRSNEIWFSAVEGGENRALWSVTGSGKLREVLRVPGTMTLEDIGADGRVLVTLGNERLAMEMAGSSKADTQDVSWYDWTIAKDISSDDQWILFEESGEPAGPNYAVGIRRSDGSPPIRLGNGSAGGFSPDGKWALAIVPGPPQHTVLLPIGAGQPREVTLPGIEHVENGFARFMPDGNSIVFYGNEPGHAARTYVEDLNGGKPIAVTPEGVPSVVTSPDGKYIAAWTHKGELDIYPVAGGPPRAITQTNGNYGLIQWSADGSALYLVGPAEIPVTIYRLEIGTGKIQKVRELSPSTRAGVISIEPLVVNRTGTKFLYSYVQDLSDLYVINGLQ